MVTDYMQKRPDILYLHGLNSSPASFKAQQLMKHWQQAGLPPAKLHVPALPNDPVHAMAVLEQWLAGRSDVVLIGSSLGGYYATYLAEKYHYKALLINPAVQPCLRFQQYLGPQHNYHTGEVWQMTEDYVHRLARFETAPPKDVGRYWVWLQTGDETLDYRDAEGFYQHCRLDIQIGGDHSYQGFTERIPELLAFAGYD